MPLNDLSDLLLYWSICLAGIAACGGWWRAERRGLWYQHQFGTTLRLLQKAQVREADANTRANRAEFACEELRASLMRGSAVARFTRPTPAPGADEWYWHVFTEKGQLLLTDEQLAVALERAGKLLKP